MSQNIPPVAALITHQVTDFSVWFAKFEAHQAARAGAGILGHHLNRGADDDRTVALYLPASDAGRLVSFLADDELRSAMRAAGVTGTPSIKIITPRSVDLDMSRACAGMIVSHQVESYDKWRAVYDGFDAGRKELGITGHAVNQVADDPKTVIVYHQAESIDTLRAFMSQAALKSAMAEAGVTSLPDVSYWNASPVAAY